MKFQRKVGIVFLAVILITVTLLYHVWAQNIGVYNGIHCYNHVYCNNWAYVSSSRSYALNDVIFIRHITPPGYYEGSGDAWATVAPDVAYTNNDPIWLELNADGSYEANDVSMESFGGAHDDKDANAAGHIDTPLYASTYAYARDTHFTNLSEGFVDYPVMLIVVSSGPRVSSISDLPRGYFTGHISTILRGESPYGVDGYSRESSICWISVSENSSGDREYNTSSSLTNYAIVERDEFYSASAHGNGID